MKQIFNLTIEMNSVATLEDAVEVVRNVYPMLVPFTKEGVRTGILDLQEGAVVIEWKYEGEHDRKN